MKLGGRAAERLVRGEASTGAADDLASATGLATQMVREFGLSEAIGPVSYSDQPGGHPALAPRGYSEQTQWLLDQEIAALLTTAETRAHELLTRHIEALNLLTSRAARAGNHHRRRGPCPALCHPAPLPAAPGAIAVPGQPARRTHTSTKEISR